MAARRSVPFYKLGSGISVPMTLHEENRHRLCDRMKKTGVIKDKSYIMLQGGSDAAIGGSDSNFVFRQESYFHWTFGVLEPDFFGLIDIKSEKVTLFMPRLSEEYAVFMGPLETIDEVKTKYAVDRVHFVDEIAAILKNLDAAEIHILHGLNTDRNDYNTEIHFEGIDEFKVKINKTVLYNEITECRVIKSKLELDVLRYANKMSSAAHKEVMRTVKPGMFEYQVESLFAHNCYFHGAMRNMAYTAIGATGCNCAVLHYGHAGAPNDREIKDGDMCLFDMGGEYYCYTSDITCSYPVNGRFTDDQRMVYEAVLSANRAVIEAIRPGVSWSDMHLLAERRILEHLLAHGLLQGDVDAMMRVRLGAVFMPHGLGHFMGVDVHDVGGYIGDGLARSSEAGLSRLRTRRWLLEGMVITVEPGCYFIEALIEAALADQSRACFLVADRLARLRGTGGVRIEDDVIVTAEGVELMTDVPRTVDEIERWMAGDR